MNLNNFPVTHTYVVNVYELAVFIEHNLHRYLKLNPSPDEKPGKNAVPFPNTGIAMIGSYLSRLVVEFCSQHTRNAPLSFEETMMPYIKDEWHFVYDDTEHRNVLNDELFSTLRNLMLDIQTDVKVFLGSDKWIMHSTQVQGSDVYVYKGVDFRIADWTRRMDEGAWTSEQAPQNRILTANEQALIDEQKHRQQEAKDKAEHLATFGKI